MSTAKKPEVKIPANGFMASGFFWAMSYSFISITITLFNKVVLTTYGFNSPMTLTLLQGLVTVISLEVMKKAGYIEYPDFNWVTARKVAPLSFVFIAYVVISLISLERVNVPMFTALRRLTVVFVMIEEYFLLQIVPSGSVMNTILMQMVGAAIAAWKDLTFDPVSYFYLFLTNLFTSLYTVYINVVRKDSGLNQFAMLYYSNVTTMPILAVFAWYTGDIQKALDYPHFFDLFFQLNFQMSVFLAFLLNVSTFYCTSLNSARTQTVVGQLKNFVAFILGLILFDDYIYDPINMFGLWVGFAGSVWYSYVVAYEKKKTPPTVLPATASSSSSSTSNSGSNNNGSASLENSSSSSGSSSNNGSATASSIPNTTTTKTTSSSSSQDLNSISVADPESGGHNNNNGSSGGTPNENNGDSSSASGVASHSEQLRGRAGKNN